MGHHQKLQVLKIIAWDRQHCGRCIRFSLIVQVTSGTDYHT